MLPMRRFRKIQAAIEEYDGQEMKTMVVWPYLKVFWFSKDNSTGHSEWKKRRGRQKKKWEDNIKEWTWMDLTSSTRAAEDRTRWKGVVVKSSVVPRRPCKVIG